MEQATRPMSKEEFEALDPKTRGYAVYMMGNRSDEPNVPNEDNPYPAGSPEHAAWDDGQSLAVQDVQDDP